MKHPRLSSTVAFKPSIAGVRQFIDGSRDWFWRLSLGLRARSQCRSGGTIAIPWHRSGVRAAEVCSWPFERMSDSTLNRALSIHLA
jgi:hypothetical protein